MPGLSAVDEERIRQTRLVLFAAHVSAAGAFVAAQHRTVLFVRMRRYACEHRRPSALQAHRSNTVPRCDNDRKIEHVRLPMMTECDMRLDTDNVRAWPRVPPHRTQTTPRG